VLTISPSTTVGELVRQRPARSRVFEQFKIDYCCGGKTPLEEACAAKGLDTDEVLRSLLLIGHAETPADPDSMGLTELADHIEKTHHAYLRAELPRLDFMTRKVAAVHAESEPRLNDIRTVFAACKEELESHMLKEEQILFPMIRQLEAADAPVAFHCGTLANPIRMMEHEHDSAGDALELLRQLTDDYTPPSWACNTYRAMVDALGAFERDMHQHVHKENNILFPKALRLETERQGGAA
jgi:regulator of cell morphogenesis and NO signaling